MNGLNGLLQMNDKTEYEFICENEVLKYADYCLSTLRLLTSRNSKRLSEISGF
jgi:hypothetical protein